MYCYARVFVHVTSLLETMESDPWSQKAAEYFAVMIDSVKLTRRKTRCLFSCQSFTDSRLMWQQITVTVEPSMCLTSLFKPSFTFDIEKSLYICFFMYICSFICKESCSQWHWPPWCTFDDQNLFFALLCLSALLCPSLCLSVSPLLGPDTCANVCRFDRDRIGGTSH